MASVFWDAEGILFIDYLEKGKTITNQGILFQSFNQTRRKNSWEKTRFAKEKLIFHQDSAPTHKSVLAMGKLRDLHYELL